MKISARKTIRKLNFKLVARMIISAGLLAWLAFLIDWRDLGQALVKVQLSWMIAAVVWIVISMMISVVKWRMVLEAQGINLRWKELWQAYWAGIFFNNFLPSSIGGDALRILWVGKATGDTSGAATSVLVERIVATAGLAVTGMVAAAFVVRPDGRATALFVALIMVSIALLALILRGSLPVWANHKKGRVISFLADMSKHGFRLQHQYASLTGTFLLSVGFQLAVVGVNYSIFRSLHITGLAWWDVLYIIPVTSVAAMLPLGINGYGVREGAYVALLGMYQISASTAFAASLLFAFLVSLCSLYGGYTWFTHRTGGELADVGVQSVPYRKGRNEVWE